MDKWKKLKPLYKGIILIILSAFFFALMNMFVRLSGDLPSVQKSFFRNFVAFFFAGAVLIKERNNIHIPKNAVVPLLLRSGFGTIGILCNFYAIDQLALADASILNKMSPFFAILFSIFLLKEKIKPLQMLIVCGAFVGALCVIKPSFANTATIPALIGLCGGMCAGLAYTLVRMLGQRGVKGAIIVCFFSGFSCLVTLPFLIFSFTPMSWLQLVFLLLAGLSAAGGQFTITSAYHHASAKDVSVYDYSQIIFSASLGFFVFGQIPDWLSWLGYAIICSMAILMFIYNKKKNSKIQEEKQ
ncbi:MAG: DMT family transporter [Acutalibacteraceae bacterium]|nr:DMT family transporter [Acutalibacteraceae bacterium]